MKRFPEVGEKALGNRNARSSPKAKDYGLREAERILERGQRALGLSEAEIENPERVDLRRAAVGWMIWTRTAGVPQAWIAEKLNFKSAANASQQIRRFASLPVRHQPKLVREWIAQELKNVD